MRATSAPLHRLFHGTFLFGLACGISIALVALFLDGAGYQKSEIGTLALFFAGGLVALALPAGALIRRFTAQRVLTVSLVGYSACLAAFPFMPSYAAIAGVRFLDGAFSVCVWIAAETLVLERSNKENKAYFTSLYAIWLASGYVAGPLLAKLLATTLSLPMTLLLGSVFGLAAAVYLMVRPPDGPSSSAPSPSAQPGAQLPLDHAELDVAPQTAPPALALSATRAPLERSSGDSTAPLVADLEAPSAPQGALVLLKRIKTSCFAAFSYGYFQASVVLFLPLYLIESKSIPREDTIILPGLFCLGMLLCSNIAGRIADRVGHLRVISLLSFIGMLCVLGFVFLDRYWWMCVAVFGAGATFASMSPVALALVGVVVPQHDYSRANSIYNVFYASGMLLGPPITSVIFERLQGPIMLLHLGALWATFIGFTLLFWHDDPAARRDAVAPSRPPVDPARA